MDYEEKCFVCGAVGAMPILDKYGGAFCSGDCVEQSAVELKSYFGDCAVDDARGI